MSMLIKRKLSVILALILVLASFVGCAGGGQSAGTGTSTAAPASSAPASSAASQSAPQSGAKKEIIVMSAALSEDDYGTAYRKYVEDSLPDYNVTFEVAPLAYADIVNKYTTMLASGDSSVDVYLIDEIMQRAFMSADFLAPIDDVMTQEEMAKFLPGYEEMFLKKDGKLYGIPSMVTAILLFVNQDMFDEAGVKVPTNQEEFIAAAQALTKDGKYGLLETWDKGSHLQDCLNRWSLMFGGNYYDWNLPGTQEAIKFMYDLVNTYKVVSIDNLSDNLNSANQKMNDGLAAMYFQWTSAAVSFQQAGKFGSEIVVAPMPTFATNHTPMSSWMWVVNKNSPNIDSAKQFVKEMASDEAQAAYIKARIKVPTGNVNVWSNSTLSEGLLLVNEEKGYLDSGSLIPRTISNKHSEFMDTVTGTLQRYLLNEISFEECIQQGQAQIDKLLA